MKYRLELMIVDASTRYKSQYPDRTRASLWIIDWYYTFNGAFDIYKSGCGFWKFDSDASPTFLYNIDKL